MADKGWIKACLRGLVDRLGRGREAVRRCLRGRRRVADDDAGSLVDAGGWSHVGLLFHQPSPFP